MNKLILDQTQKVAVARIVSDLIESDFIVEEREMSFFEDIISKDGLRISKNMLVEAKKMDFAEAVVSLKELNQEQRKEVIAILKDLALSDGTCVPSEAILIFALEQALENDACVYSVPAKDVGIDNMTAIYIENEDDTKIAKAIESNYLTISNDFAMAGFKFVHIPFVVNDYKKMNPEYLKKVVLYMLPAISQEKVDSICLDLQNMTTSIFCSNLLYNKIGIQLSDCGPSLLIKIGESALIGEYEKGDSERTYYANFLRIGLIGNVMKEMRFLIDSYHGMINCPIAVNSLPESHKFTYLGFHRSLFDLIAYGKEQKEYVLCFNLTGSLPRVFFEPVDGCDEPISIKLTPQETALYYMIVTESFDGDGLDWREVFETEEDKQQKRNLLEAYNNIYERVGGRDKKVEYKDKTQVCLIKKKISVNQCVANIGLFIPDNYKEGKQSFYRVSASRKNVKFKGKQ